MSVQLAIQNITLPQGCPSHRQHHPSCSSICHLILVDTASGFWCPSDNLPLVFYAAHLEEDGGISSSMKP